MVEAHIKKGVEHCENADFESGAEYFSKALKIEPNHPQALHHRARALSRAGKLPEALADFAKMVKLFPKNASFIADYAVALHLNDRNDEAATQFDKALALEPNNPYRYSSRAFFKDRIGDLEGAIEDYEKCIALDPEDAIALNNKGLVEEKLGYKEKSKLSFDRSNELVGYEPERNLPGQASSKKQIPNHKNQISSLQEQESSGANKISESRDPETRWEVIKTVFTKEGFKDFMKFSTGLVKGKKS